MTWSFRVIERIPPQQNEARWAAPVLLWLAVPAIAQILLISWLDDAIPWPVTFDRMEPWRVAALNVVPVVLLTLLLVALTRRVLLASWLTTLALAMLYVINSHKLEQLGTPLLPDDIHFIREIGVSFSFFGHYQIGRAHV